MHRTLWVAVLFSLAIISIPTAAGMLFPPPGGSWTGILSRNTADVNGYLSMIEEARQGHWRMRNLFTAEAHDPFQIRPLWFLLGLAGRMMPALSNVVLMEIARLLTALYLLLIIARIVTTLFEKPGNQRIAFLVMTFGSGLGWTHFVNDPPDLRIVETSTFLTLVSPPLYSLSLALILSILFLIQKSWNSKEAIQYGFLAGLCALWLGFDRPFSLASLAFAIAGLLLIQTVQQRRLNLKNIVGLLPVLAGALIPLAYHYFAIKNISVYAEWNRQHVIATPEWPRLISSLGLMIPLAAWGFGALWKTNRVFATLCVCYIAGSLLFSHLPVGPQERFLEGLPVLTALFASFGLVRILDRIQSVPLKTLIGTTVIVVLSLSHFSPLRSDMAAIARQSPPQYMPDRVLASMKTLKAISEPDQAVLSAESSGNFLIAYAGRPVVIGQRIQTARYADKSRLITQYFSTSGGDPRSHQLFLQSQATWLFWGPEEAWASKGRFHPSRADYLVEMHNDGFIRIFKLR
jgi:hypothetical protein